MQPLFGGMPCTAARVLSRSCRGYSHNFRRHEGILIRRHASSKIASSGRKPASKPLPFQPGSGQSRAQKPNPHTQQKSEKRPMTDLLRERWIYLFGSGAALLCLGYFTASLTMYWRQEPAPCYPFGCEPDPPTGRPSIQSPYEFDLHLDKSEHRFGITKLRRELGAAARGHVLEVAIGTGRNFEFYNWDTMTDSLTTPEEREKARAKSSSWLPFRADYGDKEKQEVLSFTGVDISPGMLDIALRRMRQVIPHMGGQIPKKPSFAILAAKQRDGEKLQSGHVVSFLSDKIRLLQSDVQSALPAPPTLSSSSTSPLDSDSPAISTPLIPQKYDTILQTFGLCSVRDPVSLLSLMASSLQPNTGRILLLEHGRSIWDLVNGLLDRGARGHHERFGCWWNRDIEVIVNEAARRVPGLEVLRLERPGWTTAGTHVVVELRVRDADAKNEEAKEQKVTGWASIFPSLLSTKAVDDSKKK
ncbi:hypothetical protein HD806DRAFT_504634 [Xylariaceae sp. AK1471]|nr:hypothetical protein HD806DRAFT_504634 [Xylariaceae sp. AK1471]